MDKTRLALPLLLVATLTTNAALLLRPEDAASDRAVALSVSRAITAVSNEVRAAVVSVRSSKLTGSGVFVSEDGLIVTNFHVTAGEPECRVTLLDGRTLDARLVGEDPDSDLALLSIGGSGYRHLTFSEEPPPPIGTWVLALGNPLGYDHTVTFGIVSANGREAGIEGVVYEDFLQTDAAINAGNSGGPLVDLDGRVVGINTAKEVVPGGSQGLGFAIPAYMVRDVVGQLVEKGFVERGWLGIEVGQNRFGVVVTRVTEKSPAEAAGLRQRDMVVAIGGQKIETVRELFRTIADLQPGSKVAVDIRRNGKAEVLQVEVAQRGTRPPPVPQRDDR